VAACPIILDVIAIMVCDSIFCILSFLGPDILEHPQYILFFPHCERPSSTPLQKIGKVTLLCILIYTFFAGRQEDKVPNQMLVSIPQFVLNFLMHVFFICV